MVIEGQKRIIDEIVARKKCPSSSLVDRSDPHSEAVVRVRGHLQGALVLGEHLAAA